MRLAAKQRLRHDHGVLPAAAQVQKEARHTFGALLERASASDRIRGVLALLKRYENLFRLPTRIRQATEGGLYEQVAGPTLTLGAGVCALPVRKSCSRKGGSGWRRWWRGRAVRGVSRSAGWQQAAERWVRPWVPAAAGVAAALGNKRDNLHLMTMPADNGTHPAFCARARRSSASTARRAL